MRSAYAAAAGRTSSSAAQPGPARCSRSRVRAGRRTSSGAKSGASATSVLAATSSSKASYTARQLRHEAGVLPQVQRPTEQRRDERRPLGGVVHLRRLLAQAHRQRGVRVDAGSGRGLGHRSSARGSVGGASIAPSPTRLAPKSGRSLRRVLTAGSGDAASAPDRDPRVPRVTRSISENPFSSVDDGRTVSVMTCAERAMWTGFIPAPPRPRPACTPTPARWPTVPA